MHWRLFFLIIFLLVILFVPVTVFAQSSAQKTVVLPKSQTVDNNYFGTGNTVDVEGTVNGDAYLAGGTIFMNGTVNGDVLAAGGQITIRGTAHNVRVAGGQVIIEGKVTGNVTAVGGSVTLANGSNIAGSIVGAGGQFLLSGPIGKTATLGGGQVTVGNTVGSDVSVAAQQLTLTSDAKVHGTLWYQSQQNAQIDKGASVSGKIAHTYPPQQENKTAPIALFAGINIFFTIAMFIIELIIGALLLSLFPNYSKRVVDTIRKSIWPPLGIGLLSWVITPIVALLLIITLFGIPLAIFTIIAVVILSYIGRLYAAVFFGDWILRLSDQRRINIFTAFFVGIIAFEIISLIPFLGGLFALFLGAIGFGAVLMADRNYYIDLRHKKII